MEHAKLPKYPDYAFPTLTALKQKGGSATIEEIEDAVAEIMKLSSDLLSIPHGDTARSEFQYKLAWVRTYLKKYGALENSDRGVWAITEKGEKITESEAKKIFRVIQDQQREKREADGDRKRFGERRFVGDGARRGQIRQDRSSCGSSFARR